MKSPKSFDLNERILQALEYRAYPSLRGIAAELGLSSTWLRKKVETLRKIQMIGGWPLIIHPLALQKQYFFFLLKTNPTEPRVVEELLELYPTPLLSTLEGITGDFSLIGQFAFPGTTDFLDSIGHLYELGGTTGFQKFRWIFLENNRFRFEMHISGQLW